MNIWMAVEIGMWNLKKPYKGTFNVRISPELHRNVAVHAIENGKTINVAVE